MSTTTYIVNLGNNQFLWTGHVIMAGYARRREVEIDALFLKRAGSLEAAIEAKKSYETNGISNDDRLQFSIDAINAYYDHCGQRSICFCLNGQDLTFHACGRALDSFLESSHSHGEAYKRIVQRMAESAGEEVDLSVGAHDGDTLTEIYEEVRSWGYGGKLVNRIGTSRVIEYLKAGRRSHQFMWHAKKLLIAIGVHYSGDDPAARLVSYLEDPRWMAELLAKMARSKSMDLDQQCRYYSGLNMQPITQPTTDGTDEPEAPVPHPVQRHEKTGSRNDYRSRGARNVKPRGPREHCGQAGA